MKFNVFQYEREHKGNHKSTKKWCKGIKGREHVPVLQLPPNTPGWKKEPCHEAPDWYKELGVEWVCDHYYICNVCGKFLNKLDYNLCPDFTGE